MDIKILGKGCKKCKLLEAHAQEALSELGVEGTVSKVTDINDIADYGVFETPALVVDGEVKASGKVLSTKKIVKLLS
ncbi:MAG: thioredoxin family protein [Bacillota bacterium]